MESWLTSAYKKIETMPQEGKDTRERALVDLYFYARLVNPGYVYGSVHEEIFKWMEDYDLYGQKGDEGGNKLIMLPRAHLKSHMVATWASWIITKHPEVTILYISATSTLAETQLHAIKNIMDSRVYQRYFPEFIHPQEGKREKWSNIAISIDHPKRRSEGIRDATVATAGLTTNTTGWHADLILADDLVVPENAYTEDGREGVRKKSSQFTSIRNAGGFTMACGTRYHPSDIYATWKAQEYDIFDEDGNTIGRKPIWDIKEFTVETDNVFLWPRTIRASDGKAFGFNNQILARIRAEYSDRTQFFAQYYNNPNDSDSNRIDKERFQYYDPKHLRQSGGYWYFKDRKLNVYAAIDFAFSLSKAADNSAIVVIGIDYDANIYILDISVFKTDRISEYFKEIATLHSKWEFVKLRAEVTVAQTVIVRDLKDRLKTEGLVLGIDEYRPNRSEGTKEERIASILEHRYDNGLMWHFKGGYNELLENELVLARPAHDDIKDSLASAVSIAIKPKRRGSSDSRTTRSVEFSSRFGGVQFKGN